MTDGPDSDPVLRARAVVADIGVHALQTNRHRLKRLEQFVALAARRPLSEDERGEAASVAHQLVGSAGTFGYARVSRLARDLEQQLRSGSLVDPVVLEAARANLPLIGADLHGPPDDDAS